MGLGFLLSLRRLIVNRYFVLSVRSWCLVNLTEMPNSSVTLIKRYNPYRSELEMVGENVNSFLYVLQRQAGVAAGRQWQDGGGQGCRERAEF